MNTNIIKIVKDYQKFKEGQDQDWIYDETYEFFNGLSRGDLVEVMNYLESEVEK